MLDGPENANSFPVCICNSQYRRVHKNKAVVHLCSGLAAHTAVMTQLGSCKSATVSAALIKLSLAANGLASTDLVK